MILFLKENIKFFYFLNYLPF